MVETGLRYRPALAGILKPGRHGAAEGPPGVALAERTGLQIASLAARKGQDEALAAAIRASWGLDLPASPRRVGDARLSLLWSGAGQFLAVAEGWDGDLERSLRERLRHLAAITDQSHGRVVLRLAGARARDVLAKGVPIDLHPSVFRPGDTAMTLAGHIGVQIWQVDDQPTYDISAFRGFAGSLYGWLVEAGAEYGIDVGAQG
jgi:methylglutamate dehydrogenase subunit D